MSKSVYSTIKQRVRHNLEKYFTGREPGFIIGVSGGPDSMALWYLLKDIGANVTVVHINYQKREEGSEKDQQLVEEMAQAWECDCLTYRLDFKESDENNFQNWARDERYRILKEVMKQYGADAIAVAHHQDDQIETILQKLFRGAGLESWSAMSVWEEPVFRPLLNTTQDEIDELIEEMEIPYRVDESNLDSRFARNFLRNEWLEDLERHFPGWRKNVIRISSQARLFGEVLKFLESKVTDEQDRIYRKEFRKFSLPLRKALVLHFLKERDPSVEISTHTLDRIAELDSIQSGRAVKLTEEFSIMRDREWYTIVSRNEESKTMETLGLTELKVNPRVYGGLLFKIDTFKAPDYDKALYMDTSKITWPIKLRNWRSGDAFQPFGMVGHQNVSDHLTNRKIGSAVKRDAFVVESFEETICAVIFPPVEKRVPPGTISELVSCDEQTSECLKIEWS